MSFHRWLRKSRSSPAPASKRHRHRQPTFEALEDRSVPAVYTVAHLGDFWAADLNDAGQVVGQSGDRAVLWDNGTLIDLGTLGGSWNSAVAINDLGQVVGNSYDPAIGNRAFLITPQDGVWFQDSDLDGRNDFMIDLGTFAGSSFAEAVGINNVGQVVGSSGGRVFLWDAVRGMTDLNTPSGYTSGWASGINDVGQVVGIATGSLLSFRWTPDVPNGVIGSMTQIDTLPDAIDSVAQAINNAGQVVGYGGTDDTWYGYYAERAFLWDAADGVANLGTLPNGYNSIAHDINDSGQVVGTSLVTLFSIFDEWYYQRAFIWGADNGMADVLDLLGPGADANLLKSTSEQYGEAINDAGAVLVNAYGQSPGGAFLLTPTSTSIPLISIADAPAVTEGNTGTRAATFTISLSAASEQAVTVTFATADGSASAGTDYQTASGTLTFAPGETSKDITVQVIGDRLPEPTETFYVNLSNASHAIILDAQGRGSIVDDEPRVSIDNVSIAEGRKGQKTLLTFTVTLSVAYDQPVTMSFKTVNGTAGKDDYAARSGTLTFAPGETTKTVTIEVKGDNKREANEYFYLDLFNLSSNALFTKNRGVGTILNDD